MSDPESRPHQSRTYLVFGDLHGRILPAVRCAAAWAKDHGTPVDGVLQVGDLGFFPDPTRMDRATLRHAADDPLEYGAADVVDRNPFADAAFDDPHAPPALWFTAGNHEDFGELDRLGGGRGPDFPVDAYGRVRAIRNGHAVELAGGPTVGAVWGVDGESPNRRTNLPPAAYISERAVDRLLARNGFDVLLCHDAPLDARRAGYGSRMLRSLIELARPAFAFFGHYKGAGAESPVDYGPTRAFHMAGFELHGPGGRAETGSVGVLTWAGGSGTFEYVPDPWLSTFTRHNWKWR